MTTPPDTPKPPAAPIQVMEGVSGTWFYHLGRKGQTTALCGARVMTTQVPLSAWGHVGHLHERWCAKCADLNASPQESHKLAEELERLTDDTAKRAIYGLPHLVANSIANFVCDNRDAILAALRSSPSEQDARDAERYRAIRNNTWNDVLCAALGKRVYGAETLVARGIALDSAADAIAASGGAQP